MFMKSAATQTDFFLILNFFIKSICSTMPVVRVRAQQKMKKTAFFNLSLRAGVFLFLMFFCLVSTAEASIPDAEKLNCVCWEAAVKLAKGLHGQRLDNVAVYFFRPLGRNLRELDDRERQEAKIVSQTMEDVLTNRSEFNVLNRNSEVWAAVLHEEDDRGTLDSRDILKVGTGLGADWIVTGEYWSDSNHRFHLRARLFNGKSGEMLVSALVDSPFTATPHHLSVFFIVGGVLLLLIVVCFTYSLMKRSRRPNAELAEREDRKASLTNSKNEIKTGKESPPYLKKQLLMQAVDPKDYRVDPTNSNLTKPRTWGTFGVVEKSGDGESESFYFGNFPVRQKELERKFGSVKLVALFEKREYARALAEILKAEKLQQRFS
jgi:TolB-like protein